MGEGAALPRVLQRHLPRHKEVGHLEGNEEETDYYDCGAGRAGRAGRKKYKASARLEGDVFEDDAGHQSTLKDETITEAVVGWLAG